MEERESKSTLHDATPSWNGFNYQGKVGLYVALSLIHKELGQKLDLDDMTSFMSDYSLEYEWIEDFSIKKGDEYISLHQVKHYKDSRFGSYKDAIDTILTRKLGAVARSDIQNYLDVAGFKALEKETDEAIVELNLQGVLLSGGFLASDWRGKISKLSEKYQRAISKCLHEHAILHESAYKNMVPNYIHTYQEISAPTRLLQKYKWSSPEIVLALTGKSLEYHKIHVVKTSAMDFQIVLKDDELNVEIKKLIINIKKIISPDEYTLIADAGFDCYKSALLFEIELHIQNRHKQLGEAEIAEGKYSKKVNPLMFSTILEVLNKDVRVQNDEYFELLSKLFLEDALDRYELQVLDAVTDYEEEQESPIYKDLERKLLALRHYRSTVVSKLSISEIHTKLQQCSPQIKRMAPFETYYQRIFSATDFVKVFLNFILGVNSPLENFHPVCAKNFRYSPSFIDIESVPGRPDNIYNRLSLAITKACAVDAFTDALIYNYHYITIKAEDGGPENKTIQPPAIGDDFVDDRPAYPVFTEKLMTKLITINKALKKINE
ncbi:ABC-three component system protein [Pseudomonas svalbardensis]|uniref:ABC-three component system protein n=1 Tax=Pseudomonas svalbardensis TaxID=3042029 RepID=UPI0024B36836|nr:ABC-three component system protein [Pseudomonas sp. PMCC200367]